MTSSESHRHRWTDAELDAVLTRFLDQERKSLQRVDEQLPARLRQDFAFADEAPPRVGAGDRDSQSAAASVTVRPASAAPTIPATGRNSRPAGAPAVAVLACVGCLVAVIFLVAGGNDPLVPRRIAADREDDGGSRIVAIPGSAASSGSAENRMADTSAANSRPSTSLPVPVENRPPWSPVHIDPDMDAATDGSADDDGLFFQGAEIEVFGIPRAKPARPPLRYEHSDGKHHTPAVAQPRPR